MTKKVLRIGYVPEHFAAPLYHLAATEWGKANIELVSQPSGTGQILTSLDAAQGQKIDVAVALTEALITGIAKGRSDYKLVGSYVRTSLNWAVITGTQPFASGFNSIADLKGTKIGISRIGSGSQIMASIMALQHGWNTTTAGSGSSAEIEFKVNDTFQNLRDGVNGKEPYDTSCFMWEWYTTKPYVDSGQVRFIGNVPTPWPSWTIAASCHTAVVSTILPEFLTRLQQSIREFANPETRKNGSAKKWIVEHHQYKEEDVESWLNTVRWVGEETANPDKVPSTGQNTTTETVSKETIRETLQVLEKAGVVKADVDVELFVDDESRLVE